MPPIVPARMTRELGSPGLTSVDGHLETWEETPELRWPNNIAVYDRMRREDGKVGAVRRAYHLPLRRATWELDDTIDGQRIDPTIVGAVERMLGLAGGRRRRDHGIRWQEHLTHALLYLDFGHMPFEQVYTVGPPPAGLDGAPPLMAHLAKLGPRMPRTITEFVVARDGGLEAIKQQAPDRRVGWREVTIPIDRLVVYVNEREGADWTGSSIHRTSYKHWLIKDTLLRLGPMVVERNGMGLPVVTYPRGGSRRRALEIAKAARAGDEAGVAISDDYELALKGVEGDTRDELPLVKWHDEAIGKASLTMFLDLGHDAGARSLGDTFVDYFTMALEAVADDLAETITEHVIRDYVELNFGADAPYPRLKAPDLRRVPELTAEGLSMLVYRGVLTPDQRLETWARDRYGAPTLDPDTGPPPGGEVDDPNDPAPAVSEELESAAREELAARARTLLARLEAPAHG